MRTRIKFCGIAGEEDARTAAQAGADAAGFVLYPPSPSAVGVEEAAAAARTLPPFVSAVTLFVNAEADFVKKAVREICPALLQFHGEEDAAYCESFGLPYVKACRVGEEGDVARVFREHPSARGFLLDAKAEGVYGGSGKSFDWRFIPRDPPAPIIVAGGLRHEIVGDMIRAHRPWGVDVSGGVSRDGDRRRKDFEKMRRFAEEVRNADHS